MTNREFLTAVTEATDLPEELIAYAIEQITKMDEKNEKRKASPKLNAKQIENEALKPDILATLEDCGKFASEIGVELGITTNRASALLKQLEDAGAVTSTVEKTPSKGKAKFFTIVTITEDVIED